MIQTTKHLGEKLNDGMQPLL